MPKSKKSKIISLTRTDKKGQEHKKKLFEDIRNCIDKYEYIWVFSVENMKNVHFKEVRREWKCSRFFVGRLRIIAKSLGITKDEEYRENLNELAKQLLHGNVGVLFTSESVPTVVDFFSKFSRMDFARSGFISPLTFIVPSGTVYSRGGQIPEESDTPLPHTLEPILRNLGMPTLLKNGQITLFNEYTICKKGDVLDNRQTKLLKIFGIITSEFKIRLKGYWSSFNNEVKLMEDHVSEL
ncbi:uncharacterized protein T551_00077 [Pneumocystis jirovecii RU7]|uniref:Ribosome assembly factor mrt4 n=1 Tax=Pneumocystis jirovecii (strain RU7) TaxID=1408657 RepID=A0A0W4ZW42_PNEJ7|nr:uncharacterized protein T551_00077 [Pneumocystis jirovecii RU7]KTW32592.1 hypothetical protein T551_00077 [Pneumocystis jirovecii RU7]